MWILAGELLWWANFKALLTCLVRLGRSYTGRTHYHYRTLRYGRLLVWCVVAAPASLCSWPCVQLSRCEARKPASTLCRPAWLCCAAPAAEAQGDTLRAEVRDVRDSCQGWQVLYLVLSSQGTCHAVLHSAVGSWAQLLGPASA